MFFKQLKSSAAKAVNNQLIGLNRRLQNAPSNGGRNTTRPPPLPKRNTNQVPPLHPPPSDKDLLDLKRLFDFHRIKVRQIRQSLSDPTQAASRGLADYLNQIVSLYQMMKDIHTSARSGLHGPQLEALQGRTKDARQRFPEHPNTWAILDNMIKLADTCHKHGSQCCCNVTALSSQMIQAATLPNLHSTEHMKAVNSASAQPITKPNYHTIKRKALPQSAVSAPPLARSPSPAASNSQLVLYGNNTSHGNSYSKAHAAPPAVLRAPSNQLVVYNKAQDRATTPSPSPSMKGSRSFSPISTNLPRSSSTHSTVSVRSASSFGSPGPRMLTPGTSANPSRYRSPSGKGGSPSQYKPQKSQPLDPTGMHKAFPDKQQRRPREHRRDDSGDEGDSEERSSRSRSRRKGESTRRGDSSNRSRQR